MHKLIPGEYLILQLTRYHLPTMLKHSTSYKIKDPYRYSMHSILAGNTCHQAHNPGGGGGGGGGGGWEVQMNCPPAGY